MLESRNGGLREGTIEHHREAFVVAEPLVLSALGKAIENCKLERRLLFPFDDDWLL